MMLLVRNRVKDADVWKRVFDAQAAAGAAAGVTVLQVWRSVDAPDQVFFLLDVEDRKRAEAYMASPESAAVGVEAGALDGEVHFLDAFPGVAPAGETLRGGPRGIGGNRPLTATFSAGHDARQRTRADPGAVAAGQPADGGVRSAGSDRASRAACGARRQPAAHPREGGSERRR